MADCDFCAPRADEPTDRCSVSLDAIKYHVANAIAKLGLRNRKELKTWSGSHKNSYLKKGKTPMIDDGIEFINR